MSQLIEYLMQGGSYGYYWIKESSEANETYWWVARGGPPPLPLEWEAKEVYFGVHPSRVSKGSNERAKIEDIQLVNCLFAEFDAKDYGTKAGCVAHIKSLTPRPNVIVDSGGGYHCYWLLKNPVIPDTKLKTIQYRWVSYTGGDTGAKDLARILRVPGTVNHKYKPPRPVKIVYESYSTPYELEELTVALGPEKQIKTTPAQSGEVISEGGRNNDLIRLAGALRRQGATEAVIRAALLARTQESHDPPLDDGEVEVVIRSAMSIKATPLLLTASPNHEGHAQCFKASSLGQDYLYCEEAGWLHFNGRFWERDPARLERDVVRILTARRRAVTESGDPEKYNKIYTSANQRGPNIFNTAKLLQSILPGEWSDFDANPDLINCNNGVVDLRTGELTPHSRSQRFTYCLNTDYIQDADSSAWVDFLRSVVDTEVCDGALEYIQMALGYTFTGQTREEVLFYLVGPTRSGKGTFIETLKYLLGTLAWEVAFDTFSAERRGGGQNFDLAPLKACRMVAASEGDRTTWLRSAFLKRITGGNSIFASFKYKTPFNYRPGYKIWLSSNYEPQIDPSDDGAWGRMRVIRFPNSYLGKEDKLLKTRLQQQDVLEGILKWVVEGAQAWYALGGQGLGTPSFVQRAVREARKGVDYTSEWAEMCLMETGDPADIIAPRRYYLSYKDWGKRQGMKVRGQRTISADLRRLGYNMLETSERKRDKVLDVWTTGLQGYVIREKSAKVSMNDLNSDLLDV